MAGRSWEHDPDDLLGGLAPAACAELDQLAREIAVRDSMVFLDGASGTGASPGVRTERRGRLSMTCLTNVRGERIVVIQVAWFA